MVVYFLHLLYILSCLDQNILKRGKLKRRVKKTKGDKRKEKKIYVKLNNLVTLKIYVIQNDFIQLIVMLKFSQ